MWIQLRLAIVVFVSSIVVSGCTSSIQKDALRTNRPEVIDKSYVVLISIDGYRYDYTEKYSPPHLTQIMQNGAYAKALLPVYPSKTFTNHYSIATGLYAETHGIVANEFYDPLKKSEYRLSNRENVSDGSWYGGTPLWVAAEQQGMLAATYFWPGSEAKIQGIRASYFFPYDKKTTMDTQVNQVKSWLELSSERRPHLISVYFSDVDSAGHNFGPESEEVKSAVLKVDQAIGKLLDHLKSVQLPVNVVIVSDHGMRKLDSQQIEYLDDYVDLKSVRVLGDGLQLSLYSTDSKEVTRVYSELKTKAKHFQIYRREEMPDRYHYSKNVRCGDLIIVTTAPYSVGVRSAHSNMSVGGHGYDPDTTPEMQGVFYAFGPQVKKTKALAPFRNVHIYPFIMRLLGLPLTNAIDGNSAVLESIYQE